MSKYSLIFEGLVVVVVLSVASVAFYTAGKNAVLEDIRNQTEATIQCDGRYGFRIIRVDLDRVQFKCGESL